VLQTSLTILTPAAIIIATAVAGWIGQGIVNAIQARLKFQFTEAQRALVATTAENAAGALVTMLLTKAIAPSALASPATDPVQQAATAALARVQGPAAIIGVDHAQMANVIVGRVGVLIANHPTLPQFVATTTP